MGHLVDAVLESRAVHVFARVLLTFVFWSAGLAGLLAFPERVAAMAHFGLEPAPLYAGATTVWLLVASALVIADRGAACGAAALAVFTLLTIPIAHDFWNMTGEEAMGHFHAVMEHISLLGGLLVVTLLCHRRKAASLAR